jgi:hypothetical protein
LFVPFEKATDALTIYHEVLRDDGDINKVSDWYDLCKFQKMFAFFFKMKSKTSSVADYF